MQSIYLLLQKIKYIFLVNSGQVASYEPNDSQLAQITNDDASVLKVVSQIG